MSKSSTSPADPSDVLGQHALHDWRGPMRLPYPPGPWRFDADLLVLQLPGGRYEVDLEQLRSLADVVRWIFHVAGKSWATPEIVGHLVQAIDWALEPERNIAGYGRHKPRHISPERIIRGRLASEEIVP